MKLETSQSTTKNRSEGTVAMGNSEKGEVIELCLDSNVRVLYVRLRDRMLLCIHDDEQENETEVYVGEIIKADREWFNDPDVTVLVGGL